MRVLIIGGGPGGLYSGLLLNKDDPAHEITVVDRNPPDATYGWGMVFSEQTLASFEQADPDSYHDITAHFVKWDAIDVYYRDQVIRSGGHVFAGIARKMLLAILQQHCQQAGVRLQYGTEVNDLAPYADYDLIIGADGYSSLVRRTYAHIFQPSLSVEAAKYIWLGTPKVFDAFTFLFRENEHGLFQAHCYPFDARTSTVIVECEEGTWRRARLDQATETESLAYCEGLFGEMLDGCPLLSNRSTWINFITIRNKTWHYRNAVLLGDSVHTAHFSIGSGTKMAMEDAIALARAFRQHRDMETALTEYEMERKPYVEGIQRAAQQSRTYFENSRRYFYLEPLQFTFHLLTRSGRISYENLRLRDAGFVERVDRWFAERAYQLDGDGESPVEAPPPPVHIPFRLRGLTLPNRLALSYPSLDAAADGMPNERHGEQLSRRAVQEVGEVALLLTEPCAVSPEGRLTPGTVGLYRPEHVRGWARWLEAIDSSGAMKVGLSLVHAGQRGSTRPRWEGLDRPLRRGGWTLFSASSLPYTPASPVPKEMDEADLRRVREEFARAARGALEAGFDLLQLHMAHGYLLASFLSPLTNRRSDDYGGSLENRMRYPLEVFDAVRQVWPESKPLAVAIPATDYVKGGWQVQNATALAQTLKEHGCDLLTVLAGQTTLEAQPEYGPAFLTSYCDWIRNEVRLPVMATGHLTIADQANTLLAAGRADLAFLNPNPCLYPEVRSPDRNSMDWQ